MPTQVTEWGPISKAAAWRLGFPSEVQSVVIRPSAPEVARTAEAVLKIIPEGTHTLGDILSPV